MAVVQISRIQIRRGRKNTGSGIPQLAGGELGWAVDAQELFIGNGAVSEGSPAVGNTKILTENDNLFTLADQYTYKSNTTIQTGATVSGPIKRTLQDRLDDIVSIRAFGGTGDGSDHTAILQRAIDQLYINTATKGTSASRVVLHIEAGTYSINDTIYLPPFTNIVGAGQGKTIINQTVDKPIFKTVNDTSTPGSYDNDAGTTSLNQARNISLEGLTLSHYSNGFVGLNLTNCKDSLFRNLELLSTWTSGNTVNSGNIAIQLSNLSTVVGCFNNKFENVKIQGWGYGIKSDFDIYENRWSQCLFDTLGYAVHFGENTVIGNVGQSTGPERNTFNQCNFNNIDKNAIIFQTGQYNESSNNKFYAVGNNGGTSSAAAYTIIKSDVDQNLSVNDWFSRTNDLQNDVAFNNVAYISEIEGPLVSEYVYTNQLNTGQQNTFTTIFNLPGDFTRTYQIEYVYKSNQVDAMRKGVLEVIVNKTTDTVTYSDTYDYNGELSFSEVLELKAQLFDLNTDTINDTVGIRMKNTVTSEDATFSYKVKIIN